MTRINALARLMRFRSDLVLLWHGFLDPRTPLHLKAAMIAVVFYLISPIDFIPDIIPLFGIVDDLVLVAFAVDWIARRLPQPAKAAAPGPQPYRASPRDASGPTIDGTARRR